MRDLVVLGDAGLDTFLLLRPEDASVLCELRTERCEIRLSFADKIPIHEQHSCPGGNAANAAASASKLGLSTAVYTHLGNDTSGAMIRQALRDAGASEDLIVTDAAGTNTATVIVYQGERTILSHHVARSYRLPELPEARAVYFTSMKDGSEHLLPELDSYLQRTGAKVVFQPGSYQLKQGLSVYQSLLSKTWIIVVNREESERLLGLAGGTPMRSLLDGLAARGPQIVVITDGKSGCNCKSGEGYWHLGTLDDVPRVDVTGAGDAFASAFASGMLSGCSPGEAMRWGLMQASGVIQKIGAQAGLHTRAEIDLLLSQNQQLQPQKLD